LCTHLVVTESGVIKTDYGETYNLAAVHTERARAGIRALFQEGNF